MLNGSIRRSPAPRVDIKGPMRRTNSSVEIQRYAEDEDDEDFSDIFARDGGIAIPSDSGHDSDENALMLHSKLSNNSWLGDEDDEDDPFASMEQGFDEMDLQANIARDKHAKLATLVEGIVSSLKTSQAEDILDDLSEQLVGQALSTFYRLLISHSLRFSTNHRNREILSSTRTVCFRSLRSWSHAL